MSASVDETAGDGMRFVQVDGAHIATKTDHWDANGEPMVLLNSLASDLTMWDGVVAALSAKLPILRMDVRGHGQRYFGGSPDWNYWSRCHCWSHWGPGGRTGQHRPESAIRHLPISGLAYG